MSTNADETKQLCGLTCSVFRDADLGDCTNRGLTSRVNRVCLMRDPAETSPAIPQVEGPFPPRDDSPAVYLKRGPYGDLKAVPATPTPEGCTPWMFGGNFIYTSDSRFPARHPIPVHDRTETWAQYEHLSA